MLFSLLSLGERRAGEVRAGAARTMGFAVILLGVI